MNKNNAERTEIESTEKGSSKPSIQWERPSFGKPDEEKSSRIRLEVKRPEKKERKGRLVNQFLLREEAEEVTESRNTLKAKREQFKALFEAGMNR